MKCSAEYNRQACNPLMFSCYAATRFNNTMINASIICRGMPLSIYMFCCSLAPRSSALSPSLSLFVSLSSLEQMAKRYGAKDKDKASTELQVAV